MMTESVNGISKTFDTESAETEVVAEVALVAAVTLTDDHPQGTIRDLHHQGIDHDQHLLEIPTHTSLEVVA